MKKLKVILVGAICLLLLGGCGKQAKEYTFEEYYDLMDELKMQYAEEFNASDMPVPENDSEAQAFHEDLLVKASKKIDMKDGTAVSVKGYYRNVEETEQLASIHRDSELSSGSIPAKLKDKNLQIEDGQLCEFSGIFSSKAIGLSECKVKVIK